MKVFFILFLVYSDFIWVSNAQCNRFIKIGCKKTTTTPTTTTTESTGDKVLKNAAEELTLGPSENKEEPPASASSSASPESSSESTSDVSAVTSVTDPTQTDFSDKTSAVNGIEQNDSTPTAESTTNLGEESSTSTITDIPSAGETEAPSKKKSLFGSLTSGFNKLKAVAPGVNDKNQEAFLQKYYAAVQQRLAKKGNEDVKLMAFKGGAKNQVENEQKETDGFFTQFKNFLGKTCFQNIGCFSATEYNDFSSRPIPMLPMSPESIATVFHLYTIESRSVPRNYSYNASATQLKYSTFNPKLRTAVIVHGFQSGYALWMENLKDFIFYKSDDNFNVIVVVWEKGSKVPMYNLAATNTRVVGACIGFFIETLCKTFDIKNDKFYLIGHSLGGHTIGYAGKRLTNPKLARIQALDPAGVGFHFTNPAMRLDSTDATVVAAIHTDGALIFSEGFGTQDTLGNYDFYPNGGTWQPGCPASASVVQKLGSITSGKDITCSHSRACLIVNNFDKPEDDCHSIAYQCPNYDVFLEGRCADCTENRCELMGIDPDYWLTNKPINSTLNKKYYINTAHKDEYCLQHYQFALHISNDSDSITGNIYLNLKMTVQNETKELIIQRIISKTTQRKIHTLLVNFDFRIEKIFALELTWKRYNTLIERMRVNRGFKLKIPHIEINFMSHIDASVREKHSTILCAENPNIIVNKGSTLYKECKPELIETALNTDPEKLAALEWRQDIYAVDYLRHHKVFHKIAGTRIKETVDRNAKII